MPCRLQTQRHARVNLQQLPELGSVSRARVEGSREHAQCNSKEMVVVARRLSSVPPAVPRGGKAHKEASESKEYVTHAP